MKRPALREQEPAEDLHEVHSTSEKDLAAVLLSGTREEKFDAMAALEPATYDNLRKSVAESAGIRVSTLDAEVAKRRRPTTTGSGLQFADIEPWVEPVDGAELLNCITEEIRRFLVMPDASRDAVALWIVLTWAFESFFLLPMIVVSSPQKRCGKSTLLILLRKLTRKSMLVSNLSPASLFRIVDEFKPTLLLDEADTWIKSNEDLRGILNAGHSRDTANVLRVEGEPLAVKAFNCFCPKAIAGIGRVPDTIEDRSIAIEMRRRAPSEPVEQLRQDRLNLDHLQRLIMRFAVDNHLALQESDPDVPDELHDRAADNWRPLLAIADLAGGSWPARARAAAVTLTVKDGDQESLSVLLLADIREILTVEGRLSSKDLAGRLASLDSRPWAEINHGREITAHKLARMLAPYKIKPATIRLDRFKTDKGYRVEQFEDAFARYLPNSDTQKVTTSQDNDFPGISRYSNGTAPADVTVGTVTPENAVTDESPLFPGKKPESDDVTVWDAKNLTDEEEAF